MIRLLPLLLASTLVGAAPRSPQLPPAASPDELVPKDWPDLEQARRHAVEWFTAKGKKPASYPATDRVAIVAVGQTQLVRVDVAPIDGAFKPVFRDLDVPEADGVAIAMRASESLGAEDQKECAAKGSLARSVTLLDPKRRPVVVQHMFSDCKAPALLVGVRTAPGRDASFAEPLARAAMQAARRERNSAQPPADAGTR